MRNGFYATVLLVVSITAGCGASSEPSSTDSRNGSPPQTAAEDSGAALRDQVEAVARDVLGDPFYPSSKGYSKTSCSGPRCTIQYEGVTHNTSLNPEEDFVVEGNYGLFEDVFAKTSAQRLKVIAKYEPGVSLTQECSRSQFSRLRGGASYSVVRRLCRARYRGYAFGS